MSASIQQAYPGGLQPEEKQETNPNHFQCVIRFFLVNSLDSGLLIYSNPDRIRVVFLSLDQQCPLSPTQPSSFFVENGTI